MRPPKLWRLNSDALRFAVKRIDCALSPRRLIFRLVNVPDRGLADLMIRFAAILGLFLASLLPAKVPDLSFTASPSGDQLSVRLSTKYRTDLRTDPFTRTECR